MIKGLAITPPTIGRIAIGHMVERNGKRLPEKDNHFTITTQVQSRDGWLLHPMHAKLLDGAANGKLRSIPVRMLFNDPRLSLRAAYSAFDRSTGRPVCVGDGQTARRASEEGMQNVACPSPQSCEFAQVWGCKLFGRLNVQIEGQGDPLGSFIFRTTGYNSVRTLAARLIYFSAVSAGHTRYLPLALRLRAKSTTQSHRAPVYYVDITLRDGQTLPEAVAQARQEALDEQAAGVDIAQLEQSAHQALANGSFEENEEDADTIVEEFYPLPAEQQVKSTSQGDEFDVSDESDSTDTTEAPSASPARSPVTLANAQIRPAKLTSRLGTVAANEERMNGNTHGRGSDRSGPGKSQG